MKAINLGLSVMWGDCNIGANESYEEGNLYKWTEIMPEIDRLNALRSPVAIPDSMKCDLAERMYGSGWQIPTKEQLIELLQKCEFEFIQLGLKNAIKAIGPNGNCIYLPLAGNKDWNGNKVQGGFYWTSTKAIEEASHAYQLQILDQMIWGYNHIDVCQSVRPIYNPSCTNIKNYNLVDRPILNSEADLNYVIKQIGDWCNKLDIPFSLSEIQDVNKAFRNRVPTAGFIQVLNLKIGNVLGHGNVTFIYSWDRNLVGLLIQNASKEYIESVRNGGMVYGMTLGIGSITYGADMRTDTIVKLKPDEIYVRLY